MAKALTEEKLRRDAYVLAVRAEEVAIKFRSNCALADWATWDQALRLWCAAQRRCKGAARVRQPAE